MGTGDQIKLKEYYRMCDELVAEIKNCKELMSTDKSRFDGHFQYIRDDLANDEAKHILAYDIIYCTSVYNLYKGLTFKNITFKEKKLYQERLNKALALQEEYQKAEEEYTLLDQAVQHYDAVFVPVLLWQISSMALAESLPGGMRFLMFSLNRNRI